MFPFIMSFLIFIILIFQPPGVTCIKKINRLLKKMTVPYYFADEYLTLTRAKYSDIIILNDKRIILVFRCVKNLEYVLYR